jgi:hypothetical protein
MKDFHLAFVRLRYGFEFANAFVFALVGPVVLKTLTINRLAGAIISRFITHQPDLAVTAAANQFDQFIIHL